MGFLYGTGGVLAQSSTTADLSTYLAQVATVFQWILTQIGVLINFIFDNPFLAIGLFLFLCGAVVAFFIRIKNA